MRALQRQKACLGITDLFQVKAVQGMLWVRDWSALQADWRVKPLTSGFQEMESSLSAIGVAKISGHNSCMSSVVASRRCQQPLAMNTLT